MCLLPESPSKRTKITFALNLGKALKRRNKLRLLEVRRAVSRATPTSPRHRSRHSATARTASDLFTWEKVSYLTPSSATFW